MHKPDRPSDEWLDRNCRLVGVFTSLWRGEDDNGMMTMRRFQKGYKLIDILL